VTRSLLTVLAVAAIGSLMFSRCFAEIVPPRGASDARVRVVQYADDQVYRLHGFVGYAIHIQLEEGEKYVGLGAGDAEGITVDVSLNNVFVKPRALLIQTNFTLLTDRRRYHFDYTVGSATAIGVADDVIYSLRFVYPSVSKPAGEKAIVAGPKVRERNTDYWYCGHASLRPVSAFDDGVHTHILFSQRGEVPAIFVQNEDDSESLLNFSIDAATGEVVIHRVAPRFLLRRGRTVGCIVNQQYAGIGERLPSGATTPEMTRERRGARP
jgi:type IV secretion system protein VirB9